MADPDAMRSDADKLDEEAKSKESTSKEEANDLKKQAEQKRTGADKIEEQIKSGSRAKHEAGLKRVDPTNPLAHPTHELGG